MSDLKGEIAGEKDDTKRKELELELELEITVEECGEFLLKEGASPESFRNTIEKERIKGVSERKQMVSYTARSL